MSETDKPKRRQLTPEARERMLANLKKGREAKARKLAASKKENQNSNGEVNQNGFNKEPTSNERDDDEKNEPLGREESKPLVPKSLICDGCKKVFKHSSSKSKHIKTCKAILAQNSLPVNEIIEPTPEPTPEPPSSKPTRRRKKQQKVTIYESESESSSSEEELIVHKKRKKRRPQNEIIKNEHPPPAPIVKRDPPPQLTAREIAQRREQMMIWEMAQAMGRGGFP